MTVGELIEELQEIGDKDTIVVMAKDGEGNYFSSLADLCLGKYHIPYKEHPGEGVFYDMDDEECFTPDEDENCICLWPMN